MCPFDVWYTIMVENGSIDDCRPEVMELMKKAFVAGQNYEAWCAGTSVEPVWVGRED